MQGGSSITQQMVKMTLLAQAETEEERAAATADTYERKLNELRYAIAFEEKYDKELDPRALPQHRLLRRRRLRHRGGRASLLLPSGAEAEPAPGRAARGPGEEPDRLRPDQRPRRRQAAPRRGPGADGAAQRDLRRRARGGHVARARPEGHPVPQRLRVVHRAVLLRLRPRVPRPGRGPRAHRRGPHPAPDLRRADHQDPAGRALPAGGGRLGPRPRQPDRPGHRGPGDGPATHRRRPGAGPVPADGPQEARGRDVPQLRRAAAVRRRQRLPGRVDVQGLRAGRRDQAGHLPVDPDQRAASRSTCR